MKHLILDYIVSRKEAGENIPFSYDFDKSLNIIDNEKGDSVPFIYLEDSPFECSTTTKVARESSDDHRLELMTKTLTVRERDDDRREVYLELMTKTRLHREIDNEHFIANK